MLALLTALTLAVQQRAWRPEERVLIGSFHEVGALARDQRRVYSVVPGAISIYDFSAGRWDLPITLEDGVPSFDPPSAAEFEPVTAELWVGTRSGLIYRYRPMPFRVEVVTGGLGAVQALIALPSLDDYVYAQTSAGWFRIRRSSFTPQQIGQPPAEIVRAAQARSTLDPALRAFTARLGVDSRGQRWALRASLPAERPNRFWLGTSGGGLFSFDAITGQADWKWFGTASQGVSALALTSAGLWFGGDGRGARAGVTRATPDLQSWEFDDSQAGAPRVIFEFALGNDQLVAATPDGVYAHGHSGWRRLNSLAAHSLAVLKSVFAATRTEVVNVSSGRSVLRAAQIQRVRAVRDSIWILAERTIFRHLPEDSIWVQSEGPASAEAFIDVAARGDTTLLLTDRSLYLHDGSRWSGPLGNVHAAGLGRLRSLALRDSSIWIAGERGALRWTPAATEVFRVPQDIPAGPVMQVLDLGRYVWFATPAGALRVQR